MGMANYVEYDDLILTKEALEKRIPQKPVMHDNCGNKTRSLRCPSCFEPVYRKYCDECGQAISWD